MSEKAVQKGRDEEKILHERAVQLAKAPEEESHADRTQLLVLRLEDEWYAVDVGHVREILHDVEITRVPCAPVYVMGILSVRGEIISVCDLKSTLGLPHEAQYDQAPVVVVETGEIVTGLVADDVADITEVTANAIEPALATIDRLQAEYILGEVMVDDRLVAILNLDRIVQKEEG